MSLRIAAAQYPIDAIASWDDYAAKIARWVAEAAGEGAQLLVFPEYAAMELARMFAPEVWGDLRHSIDFVSGLKTKADELHADLAERNGVYIAAASLPARDAEGALHNLARLVSPKGRMGEQRKLVPTRSEREHWKVQSGGGVNVFETRLGRLGIALGYDIEFPLVVRAMTEAGAALVLAPGRAETLPGYFRQRVAAQARALESQCCVVQAATVGEAPWSPALAMNVGAAGVFAPPDRGFPDNGVVALGAMSQPAWLYADVDLALFARVRAEGEACNDADWRAQPGAKPLKAKVSEI